ncbi:MAG: Ribosomal large subunit pseudouridine synthase [Chlamydiota bacterium]|jgi:23S rRNA pseudouridine1911/1915/1917 synthase
MTDDIQTYLVASDEEGQRLDLWLTGRFPEFSRTYFQKIIDKGLVLVNGALVKKRVLLAEDDEVEVCFEALEKLSLEPEAIPLTILYEDEHLIAIDKPAGLVVHPAPGHRSHTFANALVYHCSQISTVGTDPLRPGIVHRLDKETTGVLIAAKTAAAHSRLIEAFTSRTIDKTYLAICVGKPQNGLINRPIGRHPTERKEMAVLPDGKEAITQIDVIAHNESLSLIRARPKTGRTHQIRVHLKAIGTPILGDAVYGNPRIGASLGAMRPLLHAYQLKLAHPITKEPLILTAPLPEDIKSWILKICKNDALALESSSL